MEFYLLSEEEQKQAWPDSEGPLRSINQVRLLSRHWNIRDKRGRVIDEVDGGGVIGEYPILTAGAFSLLWTHSLSLRSFGNLGFEMCLW